MNEKQKSTSKISRSPAVLLLSPQLFQHESLSRSSSTTRWKKVLINIMWLTSNDQKGFLQYSFKFYRDFPLKLWFAKTRREEKESEGSRTLLPCASMDGSGRKAIIPLSNKHRKLGRKARKWWILGKERLRREVLGCAGCIKMEDR